MSDWGRYQELEDFLNNKDEVNTKNKMLKPLYRELKSAIQNITYTEDAKAYLDYVALRNRIESYYVLTFH